MRVTKLWIRNFRGFGPGGEWKALSDIEEAGAQAIDLEKDIVFLFGKNNAAKSTILHAYKYYFNNATKMEKEDFYNIKSENHIVIQAEIKASEKEAEDVDSKWHDSETGIALIRRIWCAPGEAPKKETFDPIAKKWTAGGYKGFDSHLQKALPDPILISGFMSPEEVVKQLNKLLNQAVISRVSSTAEFEAVNEALGKLRAAIEQDGYSRRVGSLIEQKLISIFPELNVHVELPPDEKKLAALFPSTDLKVEEGSNRIPLENHGHGIRRQFVLSALHGICHELARSDALTAAAARKTDFNEDPPKLEKVILFEEPELFLHPSAIRDVQSLLYEIAESDGFQIIAATHSPIMIDLEKDQQTLVRVLKSNSGSKFHQVKFNIFDKEEKHKLSMISRFDPYVAESFFAERVVLVEGFTEQAVLREIVSSWKNKKLPSLHILNCGSKMNIPLFQKIMRHFSIEYDVIHDLDARLSKNGNNNPAWTINERIWEEIKLANDNGVAAAGFIFNKNFESQHDVPEGTWRGKPLEAITQLKSWDMDPNTSDKEVVKILGSILDCTSSKIFYTWDTVQKLGDV